MGKGWTINSSSHRRTRAVAAMGLVAVMAASLAACSSDSSSDPGGTAPPATAKPADPALTTALHAAATAMSTLPSYQFTATVVAGGASTTVISDVVTPDKVRQSTLPDAGTLTETVFIGSDAWTKEAQGAWQTTPGAPGPDPDTIGLFTAMQDATAVSGQPTDVLFKLQAGSPFLASSGADSVQGQATITDGRVTHLVYGLSGPDGSQLVTIDFASLGTGRPVDPPI